MPSRIKRKLRRQRDTGKAREVNSGREGGASAAVAVHQHHVSLNKKIIKIFKIIKN